MAKKLKDKKEQGLSNPMAVMAASQMAANAGRSAAGFLSDNRGQIKWQNLALLGIGAFVLYKFTPLGSIFSGVSKVTDSTAGVVSTTVNKAGNIASSALDTVNGVIDIPKNGLIALNDKLFKDTPVDKIVKASITSDLRLKYAFNPNYFLSLGTTVSKHYFLPSTMSRFEKYAYEINNSPATWYAWSDEPRRTGAVFSSMKNFADVSFLAYVYIKKHKIDLYSDILRWMSNGEFYEQVWSKIEKLK